MTTFLTYAAIAVAVLLAAFVWWRWTSVARGARKRDERILAILKPLADELLAGRQPSPQAVAQVADLPHARVLLHRMLTDLDAAQLFPERHLSVAAQAEAQLAYWMMHPNELCDPPEELANVAVVRRRLGDEEADFHVLRFRMPDGYWEGRDWLLGLAGPFFDGDPPYCGPAGAFSRAGDKADETDPKQLVDWFIGMVTGGAGGGGASAGGS